MSILMKHNQTCEETRRLVLVDMYRRCMEYDLRAQEQQSNTVMCFVHCKPNLDTMSSNNLPSHLTSCVNDKLLPQLFLSENTAYQQVVKS